MNQRLQEESARLGVEINEEKSRCVDLRKGESFGFLGFDFRRIRARSGKWRVQFTPSLKKRTALLRKLKEVFRRHRSQPVGRVVRIINPILRGWVNYFAEDTRANAFVWFNAGSSCVRDITGRAVLEKRLSALAMTDALTGLLNRRVGTAQ